LDYYCQFVLFLLPFPVSSEVKCLNNNHMLNYPHNEDQSVHLQIRAVLLKKERKEKEIDKRKVQNCMLFNVAYNALIGV